MMNHTVFMTEGIELNFCTPMLEQLAQELEAVIKYFSRTRRILGHEDEDNAVQCQNEDHQSSSTIQQNHKILLQTGRLC